MKIKEYNALRAAIFAEGMTHPEIAEAVNIGGVCYLYDVTDGKNRHTVLTLTARTQLNDYTIRRAGLDPETARAVLLLTYHQQTKCVTF